MAKTRNDPARKSRRREEAKKRAEGMQKIGYCRVCLTKHNLLRSCPKPSYWEEPEPITCGACQGVGCDECYGVGVWRAELPLHRTEAQTFPCATCDGGGCPDCTDPA